MDGAPSSGGANDFNNCTWRVAAPRKMIIMIIIIITRPVGRSAGQLAARPTERPLPVRARARALEEQSLSL